MSAPHDDASMSGATPVADATARPTTPLARRLVAEFVGTLALVAAGTGAVAANSVTGGALGHIGVALTFGLVIAVFVYAYKDVSGAQYNPAVSVALALRGAFPRREVAPYILAQGAGAVAGGALVRLLVGAIVAAGDAAFRPGSAAILGATMPGPGGAWVALGVEVVATFLLVTVILGVVRAGGRGNPWAGIAIGGTVALCALAFGPISGASMNPARSLGPALFAPGAGAVLWIYIVGPVVGGALAVAVDRVVTGE